MIPEVSIQVSYDLVHWDSFDQEKFCEKDVLAYIVSYSDGQIIDCENEFEPFPNRIYFIEQRNSFDQSDLPRFKDIRFESYQIEIIHDYSPFQHNDASLYKTQITHIGDSNFKVNRFAAFNNSFWNKLKTKPAHSSFIDGWFSGLDFKLWYGQKTEWINPGDSLCDFRNYGTNCFWLYEIQVEDGELFWIASRVKY